MEVSSVSRFFTTVNQFHVSALKFSYYSCFYHTLLGSTKAKFKVKKKIK